jgi:hypothetical protein
MDDVDAAYQNGSIDKSTYQSYYNENASALIKQAKTVDDVEAIVEQLEQYHADGKMTTAQRKELTNQLYSSVGQVLDNGSYSVKMEGTLTATITLGDKDYYVSTDIIPGKKTQNVLDKINANAYEGDVVGFDGKVYLRRNGKWHTINDPHGSGFKTDYERYYTSQNSASGQGDMGSSNAGLNGKPGSQTTTSQK